MADDSPQQAPAPATGSPYPIEELRLNYLEPRVENDLNALAHNQLAGLFFDPAALTEDKRAKLQEALTYCELKVVGMGAICCLRKP
jgi:hypothetical protein